LLDGETSEDSYGEGDVVYYHKDDLTNFSKNLDLNKIRRKRRKRIKPLSDLDYIVDLKSEGSDAKSGDFPFNTALSDVELGQSMAEWNMRLNSTTNNFRNKARKCKISLKQQQKWHELNSLYCEDAF
jgi:hypothetical protein